jgi:hypothetical protein
MSLRIQALHHGKAPLSFAVAPFGDLEVAYESGRPTIYVT